MFSRKEKVSKLNLSGLLVPFLALVLVLAAVGMVVSIWDSIVGHNTRVVKDAMSDMVMLSTICDGSYTESNPSCSVSFTYKGADAAVGDDLDVFLKSLVPYGVFSAKTVKGDVNMVMEGLYLIQATATVQGIDRTENLVEFLENNGNVTEVSWEVIRADARLSETSAYVDAYRNAMAKFSMFPDFSSGKEMHLLSIDETKLEYDPHTGRTVSVVKLTLGAENAGK